MKTKNTIANVIEIATFVLANLLLIAMETMSVVALRLPNSPTLLAVLLLVVATTFHAFVLSSMVNVDDIKAACKAAKKAFRKLPKRVLRSLLRFGFELVDTIKVLTKEPNWTKSGKTWGEYSKDMQLDLDNCHLGRAYEERCKLTKEYNDVAVATNGGMYTNDCIETKCGKERVEFYMEEYRKATDNIKYWESMIPERLANLKAKKGF